MDAWINYSSVIETVIVLTVHTPKGKTKEPVRTDLLLCVIWQTLT